MIFGLDMTDQSSSVFGKYRYGSDGLEAFHPTG